MVNIHERIPVHNEQQKFLTKHPQNRSNHPMKGGITKSIKAHYVRNYDGDTITVNIPSWPDIVGKEIDIRVAGIDTPEMKGKGNKKKAIAAKTMVASLCHGRRVILKNVRRGKYFRLVADVYASGKNVGLELIRAGLAKPYAGATKL